VVPVELPEQAATPRVNTTTDSAILMGRETLQGERQRQSPPAVAVSKDIGHRALPMKTTVCLRWETAACKQRGPSPVAVGKFAMIDLSRSIWMDAGRY
jgi:hypothetical protein